MKSLYPLTLVLESIFSSFTGVFQEALTLQRFFVLNKELWFTAFYISPWRSTIHIIIGKKYSALSPGDTPYRLSHLHVSCILSPLPFFKWKRWPNWMILRTPLLTITRLHFERMKSIPFASKYENICWLGNNKDKKYLTVC